MNKVIYDRCVELTKKLVAIPSINSTEGEADIADYIAQVFLEMPYFKEHPGQVFFQKFDDPYGRKNVFAYLQGEDPEGKTVIIHGHMDTVDIENYRELGKYAFDCDSLLEKMLEGSYDQEVMEDLKSGMYMVGRGVCDMKAGLALGIELVRYYSEHPDLLKGNLLFMGNPGEELFHNGIMYATEEILKLRKEKKLSFGAAINMDCSNPHYVGDRNNYIYFGTVGKILPCFFVLGKETHIGQCFNGVDAAQIAARLISKIHLNMEYADVYEDEMTLPPTVLRYEDNKTHYSVNTVFWSYFYFNFLLYSSSPGEMLERLMKDAKQVVDEVLEEMEVGYEKHCRFNHREYKPLNYKIELLYYEDLYQKAVETAGSEEILRKNIEEMTVCLEKQKMDKRDISRRVVQYLLDYCKIKENTIVLFLAPPFMPHSTLRMDRAEEKALADKLMGVLNKFNASRGRQIKRLHYYPSLADSSYLKMDDAAEGVPAVVKNTAAYEEIGKIPLEKIRELNIPALNMGCYGKDPHRNTERLDREYSFGVLPELLMEVLDAIWR